LARQVAQHLGERSTQVWLDENEILVGDSIPGKIEQGITESDFVVVLLSKHSVSSGWVKREIEAKLTNEITTGQVSVLVVLCERPDGTWQIPALLAHKRYADITQDFENGMRDVLRAIGGHSKAPHSSRVANQYECYVLGFTVAKIAWFHGSPLTLASLKSQYKTLAAKVSIDKEMADAVIAQFDWSGDPRDLVLKNAHRGLEARQAISTEIALKQGELLASSFRFGFNLVYLMPQLEFLEAAQEYKSQETPAEELLKGLEAQFSALVGDGEHMGLEAKHLDTLRQAYGRAGAGDPAIVRGQLVEVGSSVEQGLRR
jgi:hypothetical protein